MTLTTFPYDPLLDLAPWVGQRQASFRFDLSDGVSGEKLGEITPLRNASLTHDTTRTIKRQLTISLGTVDTNAINGITDRINLFMTFPGGVEYPLGRYMFTDTTKQKFTSGKLGNFVLNDEMFLVDQQIINGINAKGKGVNEAILDILAGLPITLEAAASPFVTQESWGPGVGRGQIIESLSVSGDYFSPWFDNSGIMRFIRTFDPAMQVADFDFDVGNKVVREPIVETSDLLTAPNIFIVVSNAATNAAVATFGRYDVPSSAPHSVAQRGFQIPSVSDLQLTDSAQAQAVAQNLGIRQTIFERVSLVTAPDPRHDSYNVIHWQGDLWLELGWSMSLTEGGAMGHLLRKSYRP